MTNADSNDGYFDSQDGSLGYSYYATPNAINIVVPAARTGASSAHAQVAQQAGDSWSWSRDDERQVRTPAVEPMAVPEEQTIEAPRQSVRAARVAQLTSSAQAETATPTSRTKASRAANPFRPSRQKTTATVRLNNKSVATSSPYRGSTGNAESTVVFRHGKTSLNIDHSQSQPQLQSKPQITGVATSTASGQQPRALSRRAQQLLAQQQAEKRRELEQVAQQQSAAMAARKAMLMRNKEETDAIEAKRKAELAQRQAAEQRRQIAEREKRAKQAQAAEAARRRAQNEAQIQAQLNAQQRMPQPTQMPRFQQAKQTQPEQLVQTEQSVKAEPTAPAQLTSREAILTQAERVRALAKQRAEAEVQKLSSPFEPVSATSPALATANATELNSYSGEPAASTINMANVDSVPTTYDAALDATPTAASATGDGVAVAATPAPNPFAGLLNSHITFNFKFNKALIGKVIRYALVAIIIAVSGYLAYDTYTTNQAVRKSFTGNSAASAMSIAGTNPATADQTAVSQEDKAAYVVPDDQPRYLIIPKIGINARVMSVGVNSKGNIDTPQNLNDTAWYDGSAKPGQDGAVFIDGHTSFNRHLAAAFNDLPKLAKGDQITIEKGNGERINYTVTSSETVAADKVDMGKALNPVDGAKKGLTMMTCAGTFNYRTQTADKRLVVYAVQQ